MIHSHAQLNAQGLACPMPIVKTKKAMETIEVGEVLEIQATDKGSIADLDAWAQAVGHQYIGHTIEGDVIYHYIRKCDTSCKSNNTFDQTISNEDALTGTGIIVDVREHAEYAFGHMPNAISMPLGELSARMNELSKDETIYVICRSGSRSALAAQQLTNAGFKNIYNTLPGMNAYTGQLEKEVQ